MYWPQIWFTCIVWTIDRLLPTLLEYISHWLYPKEKVPTKLQYEYVLIAFALAGDFFQHIRNFSIHNLAYVCPQTFQSLLAVLSTTPKLSIEVEWKTFDIVIISTYIKKITSCMLATLFFDSDIWYFSCKNVALQ